MTAAMLTIFLLSLIGVPLTGGFFGKFYMFKAALDANLVWLTVLGLLNSAVAAYYYLRIIVVMYMHEPTSTTDGLQPLGAGLKTASWLGCGYRCSRCLPPLVLDFAGKFGNTRKVVLSRRSCALSGVRRPGGSLLKEEVVRVRWLRVCGQ